MIREAFAVLGAIAIAILLGPWIVKFYVNLADEFARELFIEMGWDEEELE